MAEIPKSSNKGIPIHLDPCNFPCFGNVGPPIMATLSLPRLTIGLPIWLFSIPNVPNTPNASPVRSTCQRHHIHVHPFPPTHAKYFSPSSSSSSESSVTSNQASTKKKKKSRKKKPNHENKPPASGHHARGQPLASGHHADGKSLTSSHHVEDNPLASSRQDGGKDQLLFVHLITTTMKWRNLLE